MTTRTEILDRWKREGVKPNNGLSFRTDDALERLFHAWLRGGAAPGYVRIDNDAKGNEVYVVPESAPELE